MGYQMNRNWADKSGKNDKIGSSRKFGIELETSACDFWHDWAEDTGWEVKEDGSVDGMEFVSPPINNNDGADYVIDFCDRMDRNGCEVDSSCGFHLHVDLNDTTATERKTIALAYHYTQKFWAALVAPQRRDTYYARFSENSDFTRGGAYWNRRSILAGEDKPELCERYIWCNWNAFDEHGTVEIRSHEPTCDGYAVLNWARAHVLFVDYVKNMTPGQVTRAFGSGSVETIMREMKYVWKDRALHAYYADKAALEV